jgi:HTH-type transcriptional regulator/antitoxin HipB
MPTARRIGDAIRLHRRASGLTQQSLAELAGVGVSTVHAIEHGRESVRLDTLQRVLEVLGMRLAVEGPLLDSDDTGLPVRPGKGGGARS